VMNDGLDLYYQPQIDMSTGLVIGCEALMRWKHPKRGFISPEIFVPLAEDTGLIHRMGEWALKRACGDALRWPAPINIAVNLSPKQIEAGGLGGIVSEALKKSGLPAKRLELEVTENILLKDSERAIATLDQLRDTGISIAMDDFGTGYSSLAYLSQFRFDKIKIDRSFILRMEDDPNVLPIIRTMITLGHSLGSKVIAEGVEKKSDADVLLREGCKLAQGYYYAKPMPQARLISFLAKQSLPESGKASEMVA
ncbi:MAG: EAL domain-containing protein, partial [Fimbriimonadaceae bacterium]|nr:EAL domain-containing protein [Alphaproteobacteria bacterium]